MVTKNRGSFPHRFQASVIIYNDAAEGAIRKQFAENVEANSAPGSDSSENAAMEIKFFFEDDEIVG